MKKAEMLFSRFRIFQVSSKIAIKAAEIGTLLLSEGREVDILDTYIAATAIQQRLILVTANIEHFKEIDNLRIKSW